MRPYLDELAPAELRTLSRIRLAATARLVSSAADYSAELSTLAAKPFRLALRVPGLPPALVAGAEGRVAAWSGGHGPVLRGLPDLTLRFASARDCARVLAGAGGSVLPIPGGFGAARALRFFRAASEAAPRLLKSPDTPDAARADLLLGAAMSAMIETANSDPYVEPRLAHAPDGLVVVDAGDGVRAALRKRGPRLEPASAPAGGDELPTAVLAFRGPAAASAVLSGKRSAVVALGACEASIRGLLPLVQGLFAVLDRASQYLAVKADKEAVHGR